MFCPFKVNSFTLGLSNKGITLIWHNCMTRIFDRQRLQVFSLESKKVKEFAKEIKKLDNATFHHTMPIMLCNGNGAISHLQTGMGFVEDFRYSLYN